MPPPSSTKLAPLTASRIRTSISSTTLKAAIKNPVIPVLNSNNNLYERALFDVIINNQDNTKYQNWMNQIELFRQYHGLPASKILMNNDKNSNTESPMLLLPRNWWLQYAPFIHPSFWASQEVKANKKLQHQQQPNNTNNKSLMLMTSKSNTSLLKNQFSMVPLQSYGDSVISLALSTMDFTLVSPKCAGEYRPVEQDTISSSSEEMITKGMKQIRKEREIAKRGLQDAEFICKNIVGAPRKKITTTTIMNKNKNNSDEEEETRKRILEIPCWSDDLLLMCEPSDLKRNNSMSKPNMLQIDDNNNNEEFLALKEEACVGSFVAFIGSVSVEFGVDTASKLMWKLAK